ncbi:hypothetical protein [Mucilaginibacter glaciei]|uniref:Uncharacterized protein n=1 Tax=Mucilaginibacter glaciei TaxID=2772109 RepID=A0A926S104_9SPHI|nr:hypothetical protein [Mucilaginibacter glaciei]MBD1391659.1 hypothetical protein [Mucilaginibacter glaciei]
MKYKISLAGFILIPLLLIGYILFFVVSVSKLLVKQEGTIVAYSKTSAGARSAREDAFKLKEHPQLTYKRSYEGLSRFITPVIREKVYAPPPANVNADLYYLHPNLRPEAERKVVFFTTWSAVTTVQKENSNIPYLYLRFKSNNYSPFMLFLHVFLFTQSVYKIGLVTFISFMLFIACFLQSATLYEHNVLFKSYAIFMLILHILIFFL